MFAQTTSAMKWIIIWLVALAVLLGFHFGLVRPARHALEIRRHEVAAKTERYTLLRRAGSVWEREKLQERQAKLKQQYTDLVFDDGGLSKLDFELRRLADENRLSDFSCRRVGITSTLGTVKLTRIAERHLVLSCVGNFPDILQFVNALETHYPVVFVDQCMLKAALGSASTGISCTLECSLLYDIAAR